MIQDVQDITSFKWGAITALSPLAVQLDGDTAALALVPDSLVDPLSLSVGTRVRVELSERKVVIHGVANGAGGGFQSGDIISTARSTARDGWLMCDGQSLLRASYASLFSAIGTTYGSAGSTHFNVPNLKGRVIVGRDSAQTEFDTLGEVGGAKRHTLTISEMPSHDHNIRIGSTSPGDGSGVRASDNYGTGSTQIQSEGGGNSHNNLQPYIVINYMIKV